MPLKLINRADIAEYRQISETVYDNVLNQQILDAQRIDLVNLMGAEFYNDLIRNSTDANYVTLLDGGDYTYNNTPYTNYGLKAVLVHYTYSRYVLFGDQTDTPFSFVTKTNENSTPVSTEAKKTTSKNNEQVAFNYWENVQLFLERNKDDYPLYKSCLIPQTRSFKFSKIGGNDNRVYDKYYKRYI